MFTYITDVAKWDRCKNGCGGRREKRVKVYNFSVCRQMNAQVVGVCYDVNLRIALPWAYLCSASLLRAGFEKTLR